LRSLSGGYYLLHHTNIQTYEHMNKQSEGRSRGLKTGMSDDDDDDDDDDDYFHPPGRATSHAPAHSRPGLVYYMVYGLWYYMVYRCMSLLEA
jgi:hypothetical protein